MVSALRKLSPRPTLLLDQNSNRVIDPQAATVGRPNLLGRSRIVSALPLADGPVQLVAPLVVHDAQLAYLGDPQGNLVGAPGVRVARMISARWVEDTRRLAG